MEGSAPHTSAGHGQTHTRLGVSPCCPPPRPGWPGQLQVCPQSPIPKISAHPCGDLPALELLLPLGTPELQGLQLSHCLCASFSLPALRTRPIPPAALLWLLKGLPAFRNSRNSLSVLCPSAPSALGAQPRVICWWLMSPGTADKKRDNMGRSVGQPMAWRVLNPFAPRSCLEEFCLLESKDLCRKVK